MKGSPQGARDIRQLRGRGQREEKTFILAWGNGQPDLFRHDGGRGMAPEDPVGAAVLLASADSDVMTGVALQADGGGGICRAPRAAASRMAGKIASVTARAISVTGELELH